MNEDDKPEASLADQAANWVPPWARPKPEPQAQSFPELQWQSDAEDEPPAPAEDEPPAPAGEEPAASIEEEPEPVAAPVLGEPVAEDESAAPAEDEPAAPVVEEPVAAPVEDEPASAEPVAEDEPAAPQADEAEEVDETEEPVAAEEIVASVDDEPVVVEGPAVVEEAVAVDEEPVTVEPVMVEPVMVEPVMVEVEAEADVVPAGDIAAAVGEAVPESEVVPAEALPAAMGDAELRAAVEAILLVVDEPTSEVTLAQVLDQPVDRVMVALEAASAQYTRMGFGFDLRRVAGGWRLYTRPEYAAYVEKFVLDGQQIRLTQAALETLAVIAYKQPVTRSRISAIRGVNCDGVVRTLVMRGLIEEIGSEPESGAFLYRTTMLFLEKLGLDSVDQLPPLAPFLPDDIDEIADAQR